MKMTTASRTRSVVAVALVVTGITGCGFFKRTEETMKSTEKTMKNIEKITGKIATEGKGKEKPQPEAKHEPVLVENKVIALRVQAALKKEGAQYEKVAVEGSKNEITMTGTVASAKERERAGEIAKKYAEKVTVKNEIKVSK
jgi:osmotically-inducible protein OsmY